MEYMAPWNDDDAVADGGLVGMGGELGPGDLANLLVKLTDNALSGAMFERRAAARGVLEAFKQSCFAEEDTMNVIAVIEQLVNDQEQLVRQEIMEQLPEVALFCHEEGPYLDFVVPQHILPHIVKLITDKFSQVRKAAQVGLLSLLDKGIIAPRQVAEQVCPVIMEYTEASAMDDYRTEVTGFMSKLARFVGKEIVVNWFLERFSTLCQDPMFQVRRVCASSMGEIATVIGTRLTEAVLLPEFLSLCKDEVWGVRKGCAEVFTDIARICQLPTRRDKLTPAFVRLLEDTTRWVKLGAYQSLGSFVTTFSVEDTPPEIPELTELEKTFIERVKENPSPHVLERTQMLMLNSESIEDLTSICIQDDDEDDEDDQRNYFTGRNGRKFKRDTTDKRMVAMLKTNRIVKEDENQYDMLSKPNIMTKAETEEENLQIQQGLSYDNYSNDIELVECKSSKEDEEKNISENTTSPVVSVQSGETGVHIRVDKEAPNSTQICRSSSVLTQRPSSIRDREGHSNSTTGISPETNFNTFQYWRIPLPDIELDIGMVAGKPASVHVRAKVDDPKLKVTYASEISVNLSSEVVSVTKTGSATPFESKKGEESNQCGGGDGLRENLQIQTISSSTIEDHEMDTATKLESSLTNTSVALVDGRVAEVHRSYMDLYNVAKDINGGGQGIQDISFDMHRLDAYDDDSDDQLSACTFPFRDEPKKTRLLPELPKSSIVLKQDVVPDILLDHFVGMSQQDADAELAPCCVFNLPAVVLTLGPQHWSMLRECYENLASSLQWKVRYTLAACLHEIANILGPELSERDLIPFYSALMKDLDEVRVGVLKHLAYFFKILGGEERKKCLKSIKGFIKTENPRNWRFRLELVYQIQQLVDMFEMDDVFKHVCPVCIDLIKDNVAEIRKESLHAVTYVVKRLNECHAAIGGAGDPDVVHEFLVDLVKSLSESSRWVRRQTFAALAGQLIVTNALNPSQFAQDILPHLIALSEDKVPNVRLVVARSIVSCVLQQDFFKDPLNPMSTRVTETLEKLQEDADPDVRFHSQNNVLDEDN